MSCKRTMDIQSYLSTKFTGDIGFDVMRRELKQAPLYLEVRERDDLFTLMFSDKSPKDHPATKQSVGPVFDKTTKILRGYGLDRTEEVVINPQDPIWGPLDKVDLNTDKVIQYVEGIKLTVFYYAGEWRISTTRVIDAFSSFWSSPKSFGTMFMETCALVYPQIHRSFRRRAALQGRLRYLGLLSVLAHQYPLPYGTILRRAVPSRGSQLGCQNVLRIIPRRSFPHRPIPDLEGLQLVRPTSRSPTIRQNKGH